MKAKRTLFLFCAIVFLFVERSDAGAQDRALDPDQASPIAIDAPYGYAVDEIRYLSETEYYDPTIHVTIETDRYLETDIWIAKIQIAHPSQLRTAFATRYGNQSGAPVAILSKRNNAVVAMNGDYHSYENTGIVLRQGHLYRNRPTGKEDVLIIDDAGDFHAVMSANKDSFTAAYEALGGAWDEGGSILNALTFGPFLVMDGVHAHDTYPRNNLFGKRPAQRTAIAQTGPLSYLLVTAGGPESTNHSSVGLTIPQLADYMVGIGCDIAYNLDGGSTATLVFRHTKLNNPVNAKRSVPDILFFASAFAGMK